MPPQLQPQILGRDTGTVSGAALTGVEQHCLFADHHSKWGVSRHYSSTHVLCSQVAVALANSYPVTRATLWSELLPFTHNAASCVMLAVLSLRELQRIVQPPAG